MKTHAMPKVLQALLAGKLFAQATKPPPAEESASHTPMQEMDALEEYRASMVEAFNEAQAIRATADAAHRNLTEEESKKFDGLMAKFDELDAEVKRREGLLARRERLAAPQPRVARQASVPATQGEESRRAGVPFTSIQIGEPAGATKGSWGYRSIGEFALCAAKAAAGGQVDPRIVAAATTFGSETNADGGYAVPPDFRENIVKQLEGEQSLLSMCDQQFTSSNKLTVPRDATTPWQTSGGIQAIWTAEGAAKTPSKPLLGQVDVPVHKIAALVPMTDELMEDAPALSRYLPSKVADKFVSAINAAIIEGDGNGKPEGLLEADSLITVDPEQSQSLGVVYENIVNMWSRLYAPLRSGAVWLINQALEPALMSMVVPGTTPSFPAYMPPGGLSQAPYATLMGRPVIPQEFCGDSGDAGSIILTNLKSYLAPMKVGGMRQAVSMHLYFDQDITTFRFVMRVGGQSWWAAPAAKAKGESTLSNIVTLDALGG